MSESFFFNIIILLVSAMILGEVFRRIKLPALVGHLLAGVIIGPSLLNIVQPSESFKVITDVAIFFLMFLAGLHLRPEEILKAGKHSIVLSVLAFIIPFGAGAEVAYLFGLPILTSLFVGLALAITAIPVSAAVLMEFGLLKSKMGTTVITAGIIDDVLSLVVLAIIIQLSVTGMEEINYVDIGFSTFKIAAFIGGIFLLDIILKKRERWLPIKISSLSDKLKSREASFGILLISAFGITWIAENVGLHFAIGSFFAGLIIYKEMIGKKNYEKVNNTFTTITFGLLSPIFFAFIGMQLLIQPVFDKLLFFLVLLIAAVIGKISGGFIGAKIGGFSNNESMTIAHLVNNRGMIELVIAAIGLELGIIDVTLFGIIVAIGLITTIMSPVMARVHLSRSNTYKSKEKFGGSTNNDI
jgi:Kef-type K+ transport system membrane component KefB